MAADFDVIIVGGGAMGSSAAYHLSRAGARVLLIEQFEFGHERGASHGESRIIRLSYDYPEYIALAADSLKLWSEFEHEAGERVFLKTGMLDISRPGHAAVEACMASMRKQNVSYDVLTQKELASLYPQLRIDKDMLAVYQKDAGILCPRKCVPLLARMAEKHGATCLENTVVTGFDLSGDGVQVKTSRGTYRAEKLIVSAGPWAGKLLEKLDLKLPLTVTQESYVFFRPTEMAQFQPENLPIFAFYGDTSHGPDIEFYGFPVFDKNGVKVAQHHAGPVTDPDERTFDVPQAIVDVLSGYVRKHLPGAYGEVIHKMTCLYTTTPDRHFVIDRLPAAPSVIIAAGFSGHGFKFAILIGKILSGLVIPGGATYPLDLFSLSRFQNAKSECRESVQAPLINEL